MIERGVLSRTVKLQLVVSKNAVEQRKAQRQFSNVRCDRQCHQAVHGASPCNKSIAFILTIARLDTPKE
jgi:hypothetical protein